MSSTMANLKHHAHLRIDHEVWHALRVATIERDRTASYLVEQALRVYLSIRKEKPAKETRNNG